MSFGNLKRWEIIALAVVAAAAVVLRILEENGVFSVPRVPAIIFLMVLVGAFFLRRPAVLAVDLIKKRPADKDRLSGAAIDIVFALLAEGVLTYLLLYSG